MAEVVNMPRLSDTMEEGTVAKWHKKVGDKVSEGDLLAEIETDKATMEFEAFQEGTLLHIGVEEGATAPVDSVLAILGQEGEDISDLIDGGTSGSGKKEGKEQVEKGKKDKEEKKEEEDEPEEEEKEEKKGGEKEEKEAEDDQPEKAKEEESSAKEGERVKASPLAKKLAEDKGIDIARVKGTGEGGRIVKRDIDEYKPGKKAVAEREPAQAEEIPLSQMRKTIAKRLSESKFTAPHFYLTMEVDMSNAIAARKSINEIAETKISFNDIVIKAVAVSLRKHTKINSSWMGDKIKIHKDINIGVAVAVEEGLLVPVVRHADEKGLSRINSEVREFAAKARDKKLQPSDWEGNTFTISNLGMYGIEEFTAIINSPDSCILAVGAVKEVPVVRNGEVVPGSVMKVTMSCDHRVVDGATGAEFLQTFKSIMENPLNMLL